MLCDFNTEKQIKLKIYLYLIQRGKTFGMIKMKIFRSSFIFEQNFTFWE